MKPENGDSRPALPLDLPPALTPRVVFEDTHVLVVSKPSGLLSQGEETGDVNLVDWARGHVGRHYVGLIHRLDRNTSGLMVLAKRSKAAARLTEALQKGTLLREYEAWVHGSLQGKQVWTHTLVKDERTNLSRAYPVQRGALPQKSGGWTERKNSPEKISPKEARLCAEALENSHWRGAPITRVRYRLETGRSHQIRAQSAAEGHPLLGDPKYSGRADGFPRLALHSVFLEFPHPMSQEVLSFEDSLPSELQKLSAGVNLRAP